MGDFSVKFEAVLPDAIEKRSFEIIAEELKRNGKVLIPETAGVVMRAIHTSADFEYADSLVFSKDAVAKAAEALRSGAAIVTDTSMALSGINKPAMHSLGVSGYCYISDPEVADKAVADGTTRSAAAVDVAVRRHGENLIYACGNAPTALMRLGELIQRGEVRPKLIIGVPVGFVNVVQSKEFIIAAAGAEGIAVPYIVARGRKGGSNVAAAIVNAIMYSITRDT